MTEQRIDWPRTAPDALIAMLTLERYVHTSSLEPSLRELVKLRASQINGCAYCVDMHAKDARAGGESQQRLDALAVWREAPFFSDRERAALAWTEALTLVSTSGAPDELYDAVRAHFSEQETVDLTFAIVTINAWNRLAISFRPPVGGYEPAHATAAV